MKDNVVNKAVYYIRYLSELAKCFLWKRQLS